VDALDELAHPVFFFFGFFVFGSGLEEKVGVEREREKWALVSKERKETDRETNGGMRPLSPRSLSLLSHQMAKICLRDTVFAGAVVFVVAVPPPEAGGILGKRRAGIGKKASGVFFLPSVVVAGSSTREIFGVFFPPPSSSFGLHV